MELILKEPNEYKYWAGLCIRCEEAKQIYNISLSREEAIRLRDLIDSCLKDEEENGRSN